MKFRVNGIDHDVQDSEVMLKRFDKRTRAYATINGKLERKWATKAEARAWNEFDCEGPMTTNPDPNEETPADIQAPSNWDEPRKDGMAGEYRKKFLSDKLADATRDDYLSSHPSSKDVTCYEGMNGGPKPRDIQEAAQDALVHSLPGTSLVPQDAFKFLEARHAARERLRENAYVMRDTLPHDNCAPGVRRIEIRDVLEEDPSLSYAHSTSTELVELWDVLDEETPVDYPEIYVAERKPWGFWQNLALAVLVIIGLVLIGIYWGQR